MKQHLFKLSAILKKEFFAKTPNYNIFCNPQCPNCGKNSFVMIKIFSEEHYWLGKTLPPNFPLFDFFYKHNNIYYIGDCKRCYPDGKDDRFVTNLFKLQKRVNKYKKRHKCEFIVVTANPKTNSIYNSKLEIEKKIKAAQTVIPINFNEINLKLCNEYMC